LPAVQQPNRNKETFGAMITYAFIVLAVIVFTTSTAYLIIAIRRRSGRHTNGGQSSEDQTYNIELSDGSLRLLNNHRLAERIMESMGQRRSYRDDFIEWFERQVILQQLQRYVRNNRVVRTGDTELDDDDIIHDVSQLSHRYQLAGLIDRNQLAGLIEQPPLYEQLQPLEQRAPPSYCETVGQLSRPPSYKDIVATVV